jgi:hypothetical protein
MRRKVLLIGGIAAATLLAGGWASAQTDGHGPGGFGPGAMHGGFGQGGFGPGAMQGRHGQSGQGIGGMHGRMGQGMHGQTGMRGQMGPGMHGRMGQGLRGQTGFGTHGAPGSTRFDPARIDTLKTELGIAPAQETAWTKYAKTVQDAAAAMTTAREGIREQAQKQHETVRTAANELLATLDDTQKAKAQQTLPGLAFGHGPTRGAGLGGPQHRH